MVLTRIARTKESFKDKVSMLSESSQDSILHSINNFENFCMEKYGMVDIIPDLKKSSEEELYDTLQSWINWNSSKAPSSVLVYFSRLRKYLHYMGIKLHDQDVKQELNFKHKVEEELYGLTLQDIQSIFKEMRYKNKVQYMCQLSSSMRIGETVQLRKKNLILGQKNIIVKIPAMIAKFNRARTTFFSKEATRLLLPLLKEMNDDGEWSYNQFTGTKWNKIRNEDKIKYLKNTYRVLLTRARQGVVIFIPRGDSEDNTRKPEFYDGTYNYLKEIGIKEI